MAIKKLTSRIEDAVSIRKQLKDMGVLVVPEIYNKIRKHSDDFINNGTSATVKLRLPFEKTIIEVMLVADENKKSGITVLQ